jgi:uncharacterized protein (TIGR03067 family)
MTHDVTGAIMRRSVLAVLVLGVAVVAARAADDDPEPPVGDTGKLAGEWELSELKAKGIAIPLPKDALNITFTLKKNGTFSTSGQGQMKDGKWKLNSKKTPRQLDMTDGNMTTETIYKLEKDVLTIGASQQGGGRPKDFASAEVTMVLKRKKK